jgi:hypothetical protein
MASNRLSELADDLLQHILSFAPAREAAASAILSRRWRPLWRRTSAVHLDIRSYSAKGKDSTPLDAFFRDAVTALAAFPRRTALKRLTLYLEFDDDAFYFGADDTDPRDSGRVAGLLDADPAAAELEELLISCKYDGGKYGLPLCSMPCAATLRVLHLELCNFQPPSAPSLAFPRVTDLRLRTCFFMEGCLQAMLDAAPALTRLSLVNYLRVDASQLGQGSGRATLWLALFELGSGWLVRPTSQETRLGPSFAIARSSSV